MFISISMLSTSKHFVHFRAVDWGAGGAGKEEMQESEEVKEVEKEKEE